MRNFNFGFDNSIYSEHKEPNIVKAKFILSPTRIYELEFDQNISMSELKLMIQKAAHLRSKNFRLFSNGEEYSKFNDETFESIFHEQKFVVFSLELNNSEYLDETELLLQMNCLCQIHIDKFLLYYCFTCGQSICCDCFTNGIHKGHKIQDKCFYLLSSKFLVDKLFENWSEKPYEEYKYSEDQTLAELRININNMIFDKLFEILKNIQYKISNVIEQYHYKYEQSFGIIRNSTRDIKVYCIKLLDDLKEKMNIKDIINNEQIFLDFDEAYKKLGKLQNDNFRYIYSTYTEFNQVIPGLIKNMVNEINQKITSSLNQIVNDQNFDYILTQINMRTIKSFEKIEIDKEILSHIKNNYDDYTQKRLTMNYKFDNYDKFIHNFEIVEIHSKNGRKTLWPDNSNVFNNNILNLAKKIYNIIYDPYEKDIDIKIQNDILNASYIILDSYNNKLYDIKKDSGSEKTVINYLYKNAKGKLNLNSYKLIKQIELDLLKIVEAIHGYDEKVKIIFHKRDNSTEAITLSQLKEIIGGSEIKKQKFYHSTRGYLLTEYGIEEGTFEESKFFTNNIKYQMPSLFKNEDAIKKGSFFINTIHDESIDKNKCDILFMVDSTGSMRSYLKATIDNCVKIVENINKKYNSRKQLKYGAIFYRDPFDNASITHSVFDLTTNKTEFQNSIKNEIAHGGGGPEDWNGAYEIAINKINWTNRSNKIVIHMGDAGGHGKEFSPEDNYPEEGPKFVDTIKKIAQLGLKIIAFSIESRGLNSFKKFMEIYKQNNGFSFCLVDNLMNINDFSNNIEETINFFIDNS